jgi:hypothetical protein
MRRVKNILPVACMLLASCALSSHTQVKKNIYAETCTKTDNHGEIDALEVLNIKNKTTFKADEYIDCEGGRSLLVVTWEAVHDKKNANLAAQVATEFFGHFHAGEHIKYLLVPEESAENVLVFEFEHYTPQRTIRVF